MTLSNPFPDQLAVANECIARQDVELRRLRLENGDLRDQVQAFDACKSDRAELRQHVAALYIERDQEAARADALEGEVERLKRADVPPADCASMYATGQYDLPEKNEESD